jgi:hypothetical protein
MKNLMLVAALFAALCLPALAGQGGNNNNQGGNNNNQGVRGAPGPIAGAGLPVIAVGFGGVVVYWLIKRRRRTA